MGLVHCPECGHEVSTAARACPSCGHPFWEASPALSPAQVLAAERGLHAFSVQLLLTAVLVGLWTASWWGFWGTLVVLWAVSSVRVLAPWLAVGLCVLMAGMAAGLAHELGLGALGVTAVGVVVLLATLGWNMAAMAALRARFLG